MKLDLGFIAPVDWQMADRGDLAGWRSTLYGSKALGEMVVVTRKAGHAPLELGKRLCTDFTSVYLLLLDALSKD